MGDNGERGGRREEKGHVVRVRVPTLIIASFLALAAVGTAYLAGVMSGRQAQPAESPAPAAGQPFDASKKKDADSERNEPILSAEQLEFARVLRNEETGSLSKLKPDPEKNAAADKKAAQREPEAPPRPSLRQTLEAEKSGEIADYLFQAGAFRDEKTVDNLREKLEGHGLRTLMRKEGKVYLVLVRLRGTAGRAAELVGLLGELGLGEPVLRGRSPVKP